MTEEREYVLGTNDREIARLHLQHAIWASDAAAVWRRAGFRSGDRLIDVGSGPGFAALDLAAIVGDQGHVLAIDQSQRFLDFLDRQSAARGMSNLTTLRVDLTTYSFENLRVSGAWLRWVLAFVPNPQLVLSRLVDALQPGARIVLHEYCAYESWKLIPRVAAFERFVSVVMTSWRARGGEPNVGLYLIPWLEQLGMCVEHTRIITDVVRESDSRWHWPVAFAVAGLERLVELGDVDAHTAAEMRRSIGDLEEYGSWMVTPAVIEVIARRPPR